MTNPNPVAPKTDTPATQIPALNEFDLMKPRVALLTQFRESNAPFGVRFEDYLVWLLLSAESTLAAERASLREVREELEVQTHKACEYIDKLVSERASRVQAEDKGWNDAIDAASTACDGQAHLDDVSLTDEEEAWNRACNECGNAVDALSKPSVSPEQAKRRNQNEQVDQR